MTMTNNHQGGSVLMAGLAFVTEAGASLIEKIPYRDAAVNGIVAAVAGYFAVELIKYVRKLIIEKWKKEK